MRHGITLLLVLIQSLTQALGQTTTTFALESKFLGEQRNIKVHIPKSISGDETFPVVITLDAEYMFYNFVGASELLSISEFMPQAIIVGIDQNYKLKNEERFSRWRDCDYDGKTGNLLPSGQKFKDFILQELIPYIQANYKTTNYVALAGHSFTGNFVLHFLNEKNISGVLAFSPYIADAAIPKMPESIGQITSEKYLYISTASDDLRMHRSKLLLEDSTIFSPLSSNTFHYTFDNFDDETHMTLTYRSAFNGLKFLFKDFSPIYKLDYSETTAIEDYVSFLKNRYEHIQIIYGISMPFRDEDLSELVWTAAEKEQWSEVEKLAMLQIETYPLNYSGYYSLGSYYEGVSNYKMALENYEKGYSLLGPEVSNKDDFYQDILRIKKLME